LPGLSLATHEAPATACAFALVGSRVRVELRQVPHFSLSPNEREMIDFELQAWMPCITDISFSAQSA